MKASCRNLILLVSLLTFSSQVKAATSDLPTNGLALWLASDKGVTTNAAGAVTLWADQSGNANDAIQSDETLAPLLQLNTVNGHPAIHFDGVDDFLDVATSPTVENVGDIATFAVVKFDDFITYRAVWGKTLANKPAATDWYFNPGTGVPTTYRGDGGSSLGSVKGTKGPRLDSYSVVGFQMAGTTLTQFMNGQPVGSGEITASMFDGGTSLKVGSRDDFGTRMKGTIAELLIYNQALTDEEIAAVTDYLRTKYGIVNRPPIVAVSSPAPQATLGTGTNVDVTVTASDEDGQVTKVDLFANGSVIASAIAAPFKFTLQFATPGDVVLQAVATDNKDSTATSGPVTVTITSTNSAPALNASAHLKLWLRSDQGLTTNETGSVTLWADQSGNGNDASQDPLFAPILSDLNGKPAAYFNGVDSELDIPDSDSLSITGDIAGFVVARFQDFGSYRGILGKTLGNQPRPLDFYLVPNSGVPRIFRGYTTNDVDGGEVQVNGFVDGAAPSVGATAILGFQQSSNLMTQYLNGRPSGSGNLPAPAQDADTPLKIGSRDDLATLMKGDIAEVLLYDAALSAPDLENVRQYLGYKYNLPVVLTTNSAPVVSLAGANEGQSFTTPTNLTLTATATDADGAIVQVQFFANGSPIGTDPSSPYSADLNIQTAGQIALIAVATDNLGLTSTSSVVNISATATEAPPIPAAGLVLWMRADKGVVETNGVATGWQDYSGSFNNAVQPDPTKAPALVQNSLNGKPVLRFDGVDDSLDVAGSSSLALTADMTTLFVVKISDFDTYRVIWAKTVGNLARPYDYYLLPSTGIPRAFRGGEADGFSTVDGVDAPPLGEFVTMGWDVNGTTLTHYLNGQPNGSGEVTAPTKDEGNPLRIGTRGDDFTRLKGDLAELVIYNRSLSESERSQIESYFGSKYGLNGTGPQPPSVTLARASNNTLIFSWPTAADGYVLQSTDALGSPTWTDVTEAVVPSGDQNTVTVTTSGNARFFRLVKAP